MGDNVLLCAVLLATARAVVAVAATHDAFPWEESSVLPVMCPKVIESAIKCDDTVGNSDLFKQNKGKYAPLMEREPYRKRILDCAESSLSISDVQGVCDDVGKLKNALGCYRQATMARAPSEAREVVKSLVSMFEDCVVDDFKNETTTTATTVKSSS